MQKIIEKNTNSTFILENKAHKVNKMFTQISKKYDLLNDLMTFGMHNIWKKESIQLALKNINTPTMALDLCSGTGDLALILNKLSPETKIICSDNCPDMLNILKSKLKNKNLNIEIKIEDAESLNYPENYFDITSIGYGLRNITNKEKVLENIYSILKPRGVLTIIDLGHPTNLLWEKIFFFYFFKIIPLIGLIFAKDRSAYTYLPESLKTWYKQEELKNIIISKGFKKCYIKNLFFGSVAIHIAVK